MRANERFLKEARELEKLWATNSSKLLDGYVVSKTAVSLECQRLHNETGNWNCCDECKEREKQEDIKKFTRTEKKEEESE